MSVSEDLMNECSDIIACLPHLNPVQVLEVLTKYSTEQHHQRIRLTLQDLFNAQDKQDTAVAQRSDINLIQKLLPDATKCRLETLISYLGNQNRRKEILLRLLLKNYEIEVKTEKHKRNDSITEDVLAKRCRTNDDSIKDTTAWTSNFNNNTVIETDIRVNNNSVKDKNQIVSNVNKVDFPNTNAYKIENDKSFEDLLSEFLDGSIYQPSTSRAVWNPFTGNYEEGSHQKCFSSRKSTSVSNLGNAEQTKANECLTLNNFLNIGNMEIKDIPVVDLVEESKENTPENEVDCAAVETVVNCNKKVIEDQNITEKINESSLKLDSLELIMPRPGCSRILPAPAVDNKLLFPLMEMFPQACPTYLKRICANLTYSEDTLSELTNTLLTEEYPQRKQRSPSPMETVDPDEQFEILKQVLPDADPTYLRFKCDELAGNPEALRQFISDAVETKKYPTMREYIRKQQLSAQQKQYTVDFQVSKFLEVIPNPVKYFEDKKRNVEIPTADMHFVYAFLKNEFCMLPVSVIRNVIHSQKSLLKTYADLQKKMKTAQLLKTKRKVAPLPNNCQNIPLLQEMAYISHKVEIVECIRQQELNRVQEKLDAKKKGLLLTCNCCFDEEVLERDTATCEKGCIFCKECVQKSTEVTFGSGKLDFPCLSNCQSYFSLQTLQSALSPKLFSKLARKKQLEEVKAAGIEDLEMCPFCDFATIPEAANKIFTCLNPECMKESCRLCKEPSHIPLKCEEVEKDEDVKQRVYIENKMSEALLRKCYKCGKRFIKSDGCNKITCSCGALQCYVCGQPVEDYKHFNGQGGDNYSLCPLYSDTLELHEQAVLKGAEAATAEIGVDLKKLKFDPTADIKNHYSELKKKAPPLPPGVVNAIRNFEEQVNAAPVLNETHGPRVHVHYHRTHPRHPRQRH